MDIVSFTPWCGALPAHKVMLALNLLFGKLDAKLSTFPTMSQVKCIGDCYMAAGGLFSEMNVPAEHARECVGFGLAALGAIDETNEFINDNLRMRIGVNTGGPIVAGVLGTGKPTFEIIGPAINMAHEMESHGVPMKVHISRSTYELIYGGGFSVKERGEVEVKGMTVVTYLVSRPGEK
jgi:class 3 adenylate cyclase